MVRFLRPPDLTVTLLQRQPANGRAGSKFRFAPDSLLEQGGFELAVPPRTERPWETQPGYHRDVEPETRTSRLGMPSRAFRSSGTEGSNPPSSSGESANSRSQHVAEDRKYAPERCIEAYYLQRTRFESIAPAPSCAGRLNLGVRQTVSFTSSRPTAGVVLFQPVRNYSARPTLRQSEVERDEGRGGVDQALALEHNQDTEIGRRM
jgi:hypothetical protein